MSALRILHFADAHIDMANFGRHDSETGLPIRVMDFLRSLDEIVDTAINEKVDMVIFAGDAYKDRNPAPTYQREWDRRIMRLSNAGIPTMLLVGNHDLSPSIGRAHALEEFDTLEVPHIRVLDEPEMLGPDELDGLPLQLIAIPWLSRSKMMASMDIQGSDSAEIYERLGNLLGELVDDWLAKADPELPVVLTAHASVQGAVFGGERTVMLGGDLVLSGSLVKDPRLDYVALGHIHKMQDLNEGQHPPVIYPGSIERVDFGEARDDKFFVIAEVEKGKTKLDWRQLKNIRSFIDIKPIKLEANNDVNRILQAALPAKDKLKDAGFTVGRTSVVAVEVTDDPGGLNNILGMLQDSGINVEYMYAFVQQSGDSAVLIFRFDRTEQGIELLQKNNITIIPGDKLCAM